MHVRRCYARTYLRRREQALEALLASGRIISFFSLVFILFGELAKGMYCQLYIGSHLLVVVLACARAVFP